MADYKSSYTGTEVDSSVETVLNNDCKVKWGNVIGTVSDQEDLKDILNTKTAVTFRSWSHD